MKNGLLTITLSFAGAQCYGADAYESSVKPFLEKYCAVCHNPQAKAGSLDVTGFLKASGKQAAADRRTWESIYEKLSTGQMPPKGALLPPGKELAPVLDWIEAQLGR